MFSLIGIMLGLALFVLLAFRGHNLILSAVGCSGVMLLFSGVGLWEGLTALYLPGVGSFVKDYFLLFLFSALLGRIMSDGGSAKRIALSLALLVRRSGRYQNFCCALLVPVLYFALCYVGISGFVVVFTVLPIAKDLFQETDTPWRLYCCGGAQTVSAAMLVGSLQVGNIYAADVCGTTLTSGLSLSLIAVCVFWLVTLLLLYVVVQRAHRAGETFLPSGQGILDAALDEGLPASALPGLGLSLLPLGVVLFLCVGMGLNVIGVLCVGCLLTTVVCWRNLKPRFKETISAGVSASYHPILSVSTTYAIGVVIKNLEGFSWFEALLSQLPSLLSGAGLGLAAAFVMASVSAPIPAFGTQMLEDYMAAGLSAGAGHRMMTITAFSSIAPHNAGIPNAAAILRIPYAECLRLYMLFTYIPGLCALLAALGWAALRLP